MAENHLANLARRLLAPGSDDVLASKWREDLIYRISMFFGTLWGILFLARLWTGTGFGLFQGQVSSHANS